MVQRLQPFELKSSFLSELVTKLQLRCKLAENAPYGCANRLSCVSTMLEHTRQSWPTQCQDKRLFCWRYRNICFTSSLIRQLYILQQITIVCCCNCWELTLRTVCLNTEWAIVMIETFELLIKSCENLIFLVVNIQCATACSLKKVNFKV